MEELQKVLSHFGRKIRMDCRDKFGNPSPWTGREFGDYIIKGVDVSTGKIRVNLDSGICSMWYDWNPDFLILNNDE